MSIFFHSSFSYRLYSHINNDQLATNKINIKQNKKNHKNKQLSDKKQFQINQ